MPRIRLSRGRAVALAVSVIFAAGCRPARTGPSRVLNNYRAALEHQSYGAAYALMSEAFRAKHSREEFVRMMKENDREVKETVARLGSAPPQVTVSAEFRYGLGDTMRLVREHGRWRIASNPVQFYSQDTPREALRSFVRAYRLKRWDVMLRFVPDKYRKRMTVDKLRGQFEKQDQIASMMNLIEANLDDPITDKGNQARMPYGDRYEVKFVREDGVWKIADLN